MSPAGDQSRWYRVARPRAAARMRLFCFPYAGGGAWLFRDWGDALPPEVEVTAVELPGRGTRMAESPATRLLPLATEIAAVLEPRLQQPFAFFGHSFGGLLAFEVARALRRRRAPAPVHLAVSATRPPHLHHVAEPLHQLDPPALAQALVRLNGTPAEVLADPALLALVMRYVRADLEAFETYHHEPDEPLGCPITAFGGLADRLVPVDALEPWAIHTRRGFSLHALPGDHFFVSNPSSGLATTLGRMLVRAASGADANDSTPQEDDRA